MLEEQFSDELNLAILAGEYNVCKMFLLEVCNRVDEVVSEVVPLQKKHFRAHDNI